MTAAERDSDNGTGGGNDDDDGGDDDDDDDEVDGGTDGLDLRFRSARRIASVTSRSAAADRTCGKTAQKKWAPGCAEASTADGADDADADADADTDSDADVDDAEDSLMLNASSAV